MRTKGKSYFIVKYALAGGLTAVLSTLFRSFVQPGHLFWFHLILDFLFLPIGGAVGGKWLWERFEAKYHSYQSRRELEQLEASQPTPPSRP